MFKGKYTKTVFIEMLLISASIASLTTLSLTTPFSSASTGYSIIISPSRIQEGLDCNVSLRAAENTSYTFKINVTAPTGTSYVTHVNVTTNQAGDAINITKFPSNFVSANTSYVGTYRIELNDTLATSNFTVGLTDKEKYFRSETVNIRGSGFNPKEPITVNLNFSHTPVSGFPKSINASTDGVVSSSWNIPSDATLGNYTVTLSANTTIKVKPDLQTFTVEGTCEIQTQTLANEALAGVSVEVYNATSGLSLNLPAQTTNQTGWAKFDLEAGTYTFKAFWKNVQVGTITSSITGNIVIPSFTVQIADIVVTVTDEAHNLLPLVEVNLVYNYTTKDGTTVPANDSLILDATGAVTITNTFANISYLIQASRYGFIFYTTKLAGLPSGVNNIAIIAPTYTMKLEILDSKDSPAAALRVAAYEWGGGIGGAAKSTQTTDAEGNVTFSLTFGKYILRMFNDSTFIQEVTVNLIQNPTFFTVRSLIYRADLSVLVVDLLGQPIPSASVELQRKVSTDYEIIQTRNTASNGLATFNDVIGGDSRVYVSVAGRPGETQYLNLTGSEQIYFRLDDFITIAGNPMETSQFVTFLIIVITIALLIIAFTYRRALSLLARRKK